MRQVNIKSDRVATLLESIISYTGESKVEVVIHALEGRLAQLEAQDRAERTLSWLRSSVWTELAEDQYGQAPSKEEQEALLGY